MDPKEIFIKKKPNESFCKVFLLGEQSLLFLGLILLRYKSHIIEQNRPLSKFCKLIELLHSRESFACTNYPIPSMYSIIYLHLVDFYGKCKNIYHTWMVWELLDHPCHTLKSRPLEVPTNHSPKICAVISSHTQDSILYRVG